MPVRANPQNGAEKWATNLSNSTQRIQEGVQAVTRAPGQAAAAASAKWLQRVQESVDRYRQNVGAVSLAEWQAATIAGLPRVGQGAQAKKGKMENFLAEFLPYLSQGVARIDAMPSTTLDDGINRMVAMVRHNAQFKRRGVGGGGVGA